MPDLTNKVLKPATKIETNSLYSRGPCDMTLSDSNFKEDIQTNVSQVFFLSFRRELTWGIMSVVIWLILDPDAQ